MKKFTFAAIIAIVAAAISFSSCKNTPKASLKNDVDTLSYAFGLANTQGLKEYLVQQGVDTTYIDAFIKGVNEGANAGDDKQTAAYYAGIQIGQQLSNQMVKSINYELFGEDSTKTISLKNYLAGFIAGATGKNQLMTVDSAAHTFQAKMQKIKEENAVKQYGENKAKGEKFMADKAKDASVKKLPGGVMYKVIKEGNGTIPADTSMVKVDYEGKLATDGTVFDSSYKRGQPAELRANQFIKGWTEALCHMPAGSVWEVYIPQEKAYGANGQGQIKPFSALVFKIELLEVK